MSEPTFTRRGTLARFGGLVAAAAGGRALLSGDAEGGNRAVESGAVSCVLTPELTEGPYYIDGEKLRRDIREGHAGTLLTLRLRVLDASTCKPIRNAAVDIWHCDANGDYSGFGNATGNRTFLRGVQRTDATGLAVFKTIYPGWYRGRAVHIHVKAHVGGRVVHTGQLFFPDSVSDAVYKQAPYAKRGAADMQNAEDSIFVNGGRRGMLALRKSGAGYVGAISMGVHK
jgi:protocatechuate 3,4-dioxygenase beta subunit